MSIFHHGTPPKSYRLLSRTCPSRKSLLTSIGLSNGSHVLWIAVQKLACSSIASKALVVAAPSLLHISSRLEAGRYRKPWPTSRQSDRWPSQILDSSPSFGNTRHHFDDAIKFSVLQLKHAPFLLVLLSLRVEQRVKFASEATYLPRTALY